jgi:transglutaminase-like putative cysteine protease
MTHPDQPRPAGLGRRSLLLPAAAFAVAGAMTALTQVFVRQSWFGSSLMAIGVAFGAGWVARRLDVPGVLAPAVSLLALVAFLGIVFHPSTTAVGLPTSGTMRAIGESFTLAMRDIRDLAAPAEPTAALRLLATTGVFLVAMLVDIMVFRLDRPVAAGMPLLALFLVPTSMTTHANALAFVVAAIGYLTLLVAEGRDRARSWGRRLTGIDVLDDVADVSHVARVGRRIGTAAVGLALCVPLALPSVGKGIVGGGNGSGWFGAGGGSSTVTVINPIIEIQGRLRDNPRTEVFTYRADRDPDYLRLTTLDQFDGKQWVLVRQQANSGKRVGKDDPIPPPKELAGVASLPGRYDISVGGLDVRWLPLPYVPSVVDVSGDWRYESSGLAVFSTKKTSRDVTFSVVANRPDPTSAQLRAGGEIPDSIKAAFLDVPEKTPALATKVLNEVTAGKDNPYDKAVALQAFFRETGGFRYDINTPAGNGSDALTSFLQIKIGYCEQFAATMAYLARLAKIPARVVVGFTRGSALEDGSFVVTNNDAHAWPELYFPKVGWVRFEPTPRDGIQTPGYSVPAGPSGTPPSVDVPNETPTPNATQSASPTDPNKGAGEANEGLDDPTALPVPTAASKPFRVPLLPLAAALALVALVAPSAVAFGTRQRRRARASGDAGRVHAAWAALADAAEDAGLALRAADSPRAAVRRLVAEVPLTGTAAAAAVALGGAEERARYAPVAPTTQESAGLDASARAVRRSLLAAQPRWTRVRARAFPPSAVRRIRQGATRSSAAVERTRLMVVARLAGLVRRGRPRAA